MSTILLAPPDEGIKYCQSFDMKLAAPQSQAEFDNLMNLLANVTFEWENAAIAGYKSEDGLWMDAGEQLKYAIKWGAGEPNNLKHNENCLFMQTKNGISVNDDPCSRYAFPFICEYDRKRLSQVHADKYELKKFMHEFVVINGDDSHMKRELFMSHENLKLSWIDAALVCKALGMTMYSPESSEDSDRIKALVNNSHPTMTSIHIGSTKIQASKKWYSISNGKSFDLEIMSLDDDYYSMQSDFLTLQKIDDHWKFVITSKLQEANFICQKVGEGNDVNSI